MRPSSSPPPQWTCVRCRNEHGSIGRRRARQHSCATCGCPRCPKWLKIKIKSHVYDMLIGTQLCHAGGTYVIYWKNVPCDPSRCWGATHCKFAHGIKWDDIEILNGTDSDKDAEVWRVDAAAGDPATKVLRTA